MSATTSTLTRSQIALRVRDGNRIYCGTCGWEHDEPIPLPLTIESFAAWCNYVALQHRACVEPAEMFCTNCDGGWQEWEEYDREEGRVERGQTRCPECDGRGVIEVAS